MHHAETAKTLAGWLIGILGGSILLQYVCVMALIWFRGNDVKVLDDLFHASLPVLAGLAGSAVTYYFTKNGK